MGLVVSIGNRVGDAGGMSVPVVSQFLFDDGSPLLFDSDEAVKVVERGRAGTVKDSIT